MKFRLRTVIWTFLLTLVATVVVLNFTAGEKKLEEQVQHEYALDDPQYQRALSVLR